MLTTFTLNMGEFKITQRIVNRGKAQRTVVEGDLHRLSADQFDALMQAFDVTEEPKTLTTDGAYTGKPSTFRTTTINFGGLDLRLFGAVREPSVVES